MKFKEANLLLKKLNEGQIITTREGRESIAFLEELALVEVYDKKVLLTHKGSLAAGMGMQEYLKYHRTEKEFLEFSSEKSRKKGKILLVTFFLLFTLFLAALITNLSFLGLF